MCCRLPVVMTLLPMLFTVWLFTSCNPNMSGDHQAEWAVITNSSLPVAERLERAKDLETDLRAEGNEKALAKLLRLIGNLSRPDAAAEYYRESLELSEKLNLKEDAVLILNRWGIAQRKLGNFEKAFESHELALEKADGEDSLTAVVLNSLGISRLTGRDFDEAKSILKHANFLNLKNNWVAQAASVYNNLGVIGEKRSAYGESLYNYDKALEIRMNLVDTLEIARIYKNKAIVYNQLGSFDQSVDLLLKSVDYFISVEPLKQLELASALNSLGVAYYNLEEYATALQYYGESSKIRHSIKNLSGLSGSYNNMANAFKALGHLDSAHHYLSASIKLKIQLGRHNQLAVNYKNLAEVLIQQNRFTEARLFLDSALTSVSSRIKTRTEASVLVSEAYLYFKQRQFERARQVLDKTMLLLQDIASNDLYMEVHDLYRQIYFAKGDAAKAQYFDNRYDSLDDLIFEKQRLAIVKMEAERDNAEIAWLAQQNEVAMSKNNERARQNRLVIIALFSVLLGSIVIFYFYRRFQSKKQRELAERASQVEDLVHKQEAYETGVQAGLVFFDDHLIIRGDSKDRTRASFLLYKDIVLVKTNGDHLYWHTKDGGHVSIRQTMSSVEERLFEHGLLRCHRCWAVNQEFIEGYHEEPDGSAHINLKKEVVVLNYTKTRKKEWVKQNITTVPVGPVYKPGVIKFA